MKIFYKRQYSNIEFENSILLFRKIFKSILNYNKETPIISIELEGFDFVCAVYACYLENMIFIPININAPFERKKKIYEETNPYLLNLETLTKYKNVSETNEDIFLKIYDKNIKINYHFKLVAGYIIFTSGSTGVPKGIFISKESLNEVINEQIKILKFNNKDKFAWILNPAFDASLSDIFISLFLNLDLYIPDFKITNIKKLSKFFKEHTITISDIPPSILNLISYTPKKIIVGGEIVKKSLLKNLLNKEIYISYGPTETTISSSMLYINNINNHLIDYNNYIVGDIGIPLNKNIYKIIDSELFIGNNIRTGIYLNKELNDLKFITINDVRYFKSGDIVEFIDKKYIYKGRKDRQLKINGQLICPEEIENIVNKNINIVENRVYNNMNKLICEYVGDIEKKNLIDYVKNNLPLYMIPFFIKIDNNLNESEVLKKNDNFKIIHK